MNQPVTEDAQIAAIATILNAADIKEFDAKIRRFPDEHFVVLTVAPSESAAVSSLTPEIEAAIRALVADAPPEPVAMTVMVRSSQPNAENSGRSHGPTKKGRLEDPRVDQLIRLLEARSRTSVAVPSLQYKEDPRASVQSAAEARNHFIFGRRGVGKTALLLEVRRKVENEGECESWVNAQSYRTLSPEEAYSSIASEILSTIATRLPDSSPTAEQLRNYVELLESSGTPSKLVPKFNAILRKILAPDVLSFYLFIDDFYLYPIDKQAALLDLFAATFRDCNGWIKLASIERLTRAFEPSTRVGLEIPHDATVIDLDVTLEQPKSTQEFLESVVKSYITSVGISSVRSIAKPEALGRLVLSSGGVPRDYLNLFANSIVGARKSREQAAEIGREDVSKAAGEYSQSKKRDLELDVGSEESQRILSALDSVLTTVKGRHYTYFRIDMAQKASPNYELLARLVDLRFCHLVQSAISDPHKAGVKYEAYLLALSEYSDVRVQRNLQVLDILGGEWVAKTTGKAKSSEALTATQFRDKLRGSPVIDLDTL